MVGVANDNLWRKFCRIADLQDIVDHPKFRTNADRVNNRAATLERVHAVLIKKPVLFWIETLSQAGVPCSPINTLDQLLTHPHTQATGIIMDYDHPVGGPTKAVAQPFLLDGEPRTAGSPPPMHGQHTDDVLHEMGLSAQEVDRLRSSKIVA